MGDGSTHWRRLILALATWGGAGFLPGMPGTWGSLAALPAWWLLMQLGPLGYGLGFAALLSISLAVAGPAQGYLGRPDHPAIVIDEAVGLLITLGGVPGAAWPWALAGLALFRVLDILKPPPIPWLTRGPSGSLEVVVDDVAAGLMARVALEMIWLVGGGG